MRIQRHGGTVKVWLSEHDTYNWAHRAGYSWPCSELSAKRIFAEFHNGDLVEMTVNGKMGVEVGMTEFTAIIEDHIGSRS